MVALTRAELALLSRWFAIVALPAPPFRSAPWSEVREPERWRARILRALRLGPAGSASWPVAIVEARWLAKRLGPPDVQAAAHTDELEEPRGRPR